MQSSILKTPTKKRRSSFELENIQDISSSSLIMPPTPHHKRIMPLDNDDKPEYQIIFRNRAKRKLYFESDPEI